MEQWEKITVQHPGDSSFTLENTSNKWKFNGQFVDSIKINNYLSQLQQISSYDLLPEKNSEGLAIHILRIEGTMSSTIEIKAFKGATGELVITSSQNPNAVFSCNSELFKKIFSRTFAAF